MAVTLTTVDLEQPAGELTADLFPGADFTALVQGWLEQAKARTEANTSIAATHHNLAAAAWVYYRAYGYKALLMASDPNDIQVGERSETYATDQRKAFAALRDKKESEFYGYEQPAVTFASPAFFGRVRVI